MTRSTSSIPTLGGAVIKACEARGLLVELSQPGVPQTNARAERCNQDVLDVLRAMLVTAGFPDCC
eukprot:10531172-Lingulodinium_polyedra.AAC.1